MEFKEEKSAFMAHITISKDVLVRTGIDPRIDVLCTSPANFLAVNRDLGGALEVSEVWDLHFSKWILGLPELIAAAKEMADCSFPVTEEQSKAYDRIRKALDTYSALL